MLILALLATGCARTPPTVEQQSRAFDNSSYKSDSGKAWTVMELKSDYKNTTGSNLIVPEALSCQWNDLCYYNAYAKAHDDGIKAFNSAIAEKAKVEQEKEEESCDASPDCKRKSNISRYSQILNRTYAIVLSENPYQQDEFDGAVRVMCRKAAESQQAGISEKKLLQNVDMIEGIAPHTRYQIKQVAQACWNLSYNGIQNGSSLINTGY